VVLAGMLLDGLTIGLFDPSLRFVLLRFVVMI
jgi:hypothetical protein